MSRYISCRNTISATSLKRKSLGTVIVHHWTYGEARFTRVNGGWLEEREDSVWVSPARIVSSVAVACECNHAIGCQQSWARIY